MKKILLHTYMCILLSTLTGCYGYRQVGLLQERDDLPQYDSVAYEPYRLQVNDEIIYRVITMDQTIAKTLSTNTTTGSQYANAYRIYSDGTVDIPFLPPVKLPAIIGFVQGVKTPLAVNTTTICGIRTVGEV